MLNKAQALCIKAVDYSETSQIVTFFTDRHGRISAIAKGSKRPKSAFDGPLEVFSFGNIVFTDTAAKLATLTEFQQLPDFSRLSRDLYALNCALLATELIINLTEEHDPHPELFAQFIQFLKNAQDANEKHEILALLILFELVLLKEIGLLPIFANCGNCKIAFNNNWPQPFYSSSANALVCRDCEPAFPDRITISAEAVKCLADIKHLATADEKTLAEIEKLLIYHFTEILNHPPKMAKHIIN